MYRHPLFIFIFALMSLIALLHTAATELFLYWLYPWFDTLVHFLGGLFIGLSALWLFFESRYFALERSALRAFLVTLGAIIVVGVGWEIFELVAGIPIEDNFVADTITDLSMDVLGAMLGYLAFKKLYLSVTHDA